MLDSFSNFALCYGMLDSFSNFALCYGMLDSFSNFALNPQTQSIVTILNHTDCRLRSLGVDCKITTFQSTAQIQ